MRRVEDTTAQTRRVLIVKIGAIGDVIMASAMIEPLRKTHPGTHITWLCGRTVAPLLRAIGGVDEILEIDEGALLAGHGRTRLGALLGVWSRLFARRYDLVVTAHGDWRYRLLTLYVAARSRRSISRGRRRSAFIPGRYHADEYVRLVTGEDGPHSSHVEVGPAHGAPPIELQRFFTRDPMRPLVALAPGGARNVLRDDRLRRWPVSRYVQLAKGLLEKPSQVIITGGADDDWISPAFAGLPVVDLIGGTTLPELLALYTRCDLVITHDSGPLHVAVLAGTPVIGLFGPTHPHERLPHTARQGVLWGGSELGCRPCYDGQAYASCPDNICVQSISVADVLAQAQTMVTTDPSMDRASGK